MSRKTKTREEAAEYTASLERRAETIGIPLDAWILKPGKLNDIRQGSGPRFAIVQKAQECAENGGKYGHVLGAIVIQGNGDRHKIRTHDLAGFVCANGYCEIAPPTETTGARDIPTPLVHPTTAPSVPAIPTSTNMKSNPYRPMQQLLDVLSGAYRCPCFDTICKSMRWNPSAGHIPRGFLGATGEPNDVELVLVFAEPGDPKPGDHATMEETLKHAYGAFRDGSGQFHQNARYLFNQCWPDQSFDEQLKRVWVTESVLCSAEVSTGSVPRIIEQTCAERYLKKQLRLFPKALIVALGNKAAERLASIGITEFERGFALGKPGCFQPGAVPSWARIAEILNARRPKIPMR